MATAKNNETNTMNKMLLSRRTSQRAKAVASSTPATTSVLRRKVWLSARSCRKAISEAAYAAANPDDGF